MYHAIVIFVVLASILMCLIVLIQESKGGGLAASVSDANSLMGVRKTTDVVEKVTWILAACMVVLSVASVAFLGADDSNRSVIEQQATEQQATNPNNLPSIPQTSNTAAPADQAPAADAPAAAEAPADAAPAAEAPADAQ